MHKKIPVPGSVALLKKRGSDTGVFLCKISKNIFSYRTPPVAPSHYHTEMFELADLWHEIESAMVLKACFALLAFICTFSAHFLRITAFFLNISAYFSKTCAHFSNIAVSAHFSDVSVQLLKTNTSLISMNAHFSLIADPF